LPLLQLGNNLTKIEERKNFMDLNESITCPNCNSGNFLLKQEATYVYSYRIDKSDIEDTLDKTTKLPFLFDNRDLKKSDQYIQCESCNEKYPMEVNLSDNQISLTILRKAIRADHTENPEFFG